MITFEVGSTYTARFASDGDILLEYKVQRRTAKSVWLVDDSGTEKMYRVSEWQGAEIVKLGSYSMAPVLNAERKKQPKSSPAPAVVPQKLLTIPARPKGRELSQVERLNLTAEFASQLAKLTADMVKKAKQQFEYCLDENIPAGIVKPEDAVSNAVQVGLSSAFNTLNGWSCEAAIDLAESVLEDANCHQEAAALRKAARA